MRLLNFICSFYPTCDPFAFRLDRASLFWPRSKFPRFYMWSRFNLCRCAHVMCCTVHPFLYRRECMYRYDTLKSLHFYGLWIVTLMSVLSGFLVNRPLPIELILALLKWLLMRSECYRNIFRKPIQILWKWCVFICTAHKNGVSIVALHDRQTHESIAGKCLQKGRCKSNASWDKWSNLSDLMAPISDFTVVLSKMAESVKECIQICNRHK